MTLQQRSKSAPKPYADYSEEAYLSFFETWNKERQKPEVKYSIASKPVRLADMAKLKKELATEIEDNELADADSD